MGWPALLSQIVDPRNDRAARLRHTERFFEFRVGKLDPGFSPKLRQCVTHPSQLLVFLCQRFLFRCPWAHRPSTSQTEFVHHRNRKRAHADQSWASLAALYLIKESLHFHEQIRETNIDHTHMKEPPAPDGAAQVVLGDKLNRVRRKTAFRDLRAGPRSRNSNAWAKHSTGSENVNGEFQTAFQRVASRRKSTATRNNQDFQRQCHDGRRVMHHRLNPIHWLIVQLAVPTPLTYQQTVSFPRYRHRIGGYRWRVTGEVQSDDAGETK